MKYHENTKNNKNQQRAQQKTTNTWNTSDMVLTGGCWLLAAECWLLAAGHICRHISRRDSAWARLVGSPRPPPPPGPKAVRGKAELCAGRPGCLAIAQKRIYFYLLIIDLFKKLNLF